MPSAPPINLQNQVLPNSGVQPYYNQQNFGAMVGEVLSANPDCDPEEIKVKLNGIARKIIDRRTWWGLQVRGQIVTTPFVIGGSVNITAGSASVVGNGTAWTPQIIGRQFRLGYNTPPYTITQLDVAHQTLTLEMPWGGVSYTGAGYFIAQYYYSPGPNIRYIHTARNLIMAWRLRLNYNQKTLDAKDPWRINTFSPRALAQMPPGPNGEYMIELWPVPSIVQALPFIAVVQPPNLVNDIDNVPAGIRSDVVTKLGIAWALVHRGPKLNKYYDAVESQRLRGEAEDEILRMSMADEDKYRQDMQYQMEEPLAPDFDGFDSNYAINHGISANSGGGDW